MPLQPISHQGAAGVVAGGLLHEVHASHLEVRCGDFGVDLLEVGLVRRHGARFLDLVGVRLHDLGARLQDFVADLLKVGLVRRHGARFLDLVGVRFHDLGARFLVLVGLI